MYAALVAWRLHPTWSPALGNDSFQYLSEAQNALEGRFGYTSLVHFDAERSFGTIPAPLVTFPPGFAFLVAGLSRTGMSLETASLVISVIATWACVPLLIWLTAKLDMPRGVRHSAAAIFVINASIIEYGTATATEPVFMLLVLGGVALIVKGARREQRGHWRFWIGAGIAFGLAYWVRYAGLFFILGLGVLVVMHAAKRNAPRGYFACLMTAAAFVGAGIARNVLLVGNWRGGNEKVVSNSVPSLIVETARALNGVFLGPGSALHGGTFVPRVLCAALLLMGLALVGWILLTRRGAGDPPKRDAPALDILVLVAVYSACMFYAGLTTVITYGARMFVPLVPVIVLLVLYLIAVASREPRSLVRTASGITLAASFCVYVFLNLPMFWQPPEAYAAEMRSMLDEADGGKSARAAVLELTGERNVIAASNGQALGYTLGRPTLSLVGTHYSAVEWNETALRDAVQRFDAKALVLTTPEAGFLYDEPSAFIRDLARGLTPEWLSLVHRSRGLVVYAPR